MPDIRPQQLEISTGASDNDTVTTKGYVDDNTAGLLLTINNQTGTTYTITATDGGGLVTVTNAAAIVVTLPENSTENLDVGFNTTIVQGGAGQITLAVEGSDTFASADSLTNLRTTSSAVTVVKRASGDWYGSGDLTA